MRGENCTCEFIGHTHSAECEQLDGHVGDREYSLICRREMMTESGHVCRECANVKVRVSE